MAKNKNLKTYGGYITQEQEDKLLIYCEKNKITKAKAIGLFIDTLDLDSIIDNDRELETLKADFTQYKELALSEVNDLKSRFNQLETLVLKLENGTNWSHLKENATQGSHLENGTSMSQLKTTDARRQIENVQVLGLLENNSKGITRQELSQLLNRTPRTIENNHKEIENYTKNIIGIAYRYDTKTKLYYQLN